MSFQLKHFRPKGAAPLKERSLESINTNFASCCIPDKKNFFENVANLCKVIWQGIRKEIMPNF
jgi:hypothetical protein